MERLFPDLIEYEKI